MESPLPLQPFGKLASFFLLSSIFFLSCHSTSNALAGNETDQLALLAFKAGIKQDPFGALQSWNSSLHFCSWRGVSCNPQKQRVVSLNLQSQKLRGSISPYIGNLTLLTELNLQNNSFIGEIPEQVGQLFRLQQLLLGNNSLGGQIPMNISHCTNLLNLSLSYNQLVGKIPDELGRLSKLLNFSVGRNDLSGSIPASLGNLSNLEYLFLSFNNFEGQIPDELGKLKYLTFLGLGTNNLSGIFPSSLYNLSGLTIFSIANNQLQGTLPPDIGITLPNLVRFSMGMNRFSRQIPASLSNASRIVILDVSRNSFTGSVPNNFGSLQELFRFSVASNNLGSGKAGDLNFLASLTNCSKLGILRITDNHFGGFLPSSIANLSTKLANLEMGRNQISGTIPVGIQNLVNLSELTMEQNYLEGSIPFSIGKLQNLKVLKLDGNRLSGKIPSSLGNLTQLLELSLANNNFIGSIPSSLSNCEQLNLLNLSRNNMNGSIPEQVVGLSSISIALDLSHNSFSGPLPITIGNLKNLGVMDISENKLSGEIPISLGDCLRLEQLHMEGNFFEGNIPETLSSLKGIQDFDLSRNNLSGKIPEFLEGLPLLLNLNLSFNRLEGEVPRGGIFKNASAVSVIGNSNLCGGILELQLPACTKRTRKKSLSASSKIIISITSVVCAFILISPILIYCRRRNLQRKLPSLSFFDDQRLRLSYKDLLKATAGFASGNLIGIGSFGSVYKGILHEDQAPVAVKVLNLRKKGASRSFTAECRALRKIRHRNLLKIITSCSSTDFQGNNFKALVFEFMPNGSLENWLHQSEDDNQPPKTSLSLVRRLNIAIDVASALDYLHHRCQTPIVHCDLKPSNVLLDNELAAHVGDFGLAKLLSNNSDSFCRDQSASSVAIKGSIGYVAPEYGVGREASTKGDVYSYGILLLEMLTGKRPTNDLFRDGLSLHSFCKMALPDHVADILDPQMPLETDSEAFNSMENVSIKGSKTWVCLVSIIEVGVACSTASPGDRMDMDKVVAKLEAIKNKLLSIAQA